MYQDERKRRRQFAQNFLVDESVAQRIVEAASIRKSDVVLEIGPGDGMLTSLLSKKALSVLAIEKDAFQVEKIMGQFSNSNVKVIQADILTYPYLENFKLPGGEYNDFILVANLPYNVATRILQVILSAPHKPKRMIVMLQREVAKRICAAPGDMSILGVSIQWLAHVRELFEVTPDVFVPRPKVYSEVIELVPKKEQELPATQKDMPMLLRIVKVGFSSKRKKLSNNLSNALGIPRLDVENFLESIGLAREVRAEDLSLDNWLTVAKKFQGITPNNTSKSKNH